MMDETTHTNDRRQLARYFRSEGVYDPPAWYALIVACRVLGIPPWQVDQNDPVQREWLVRAEIVIEAEEDARRYFAERQASTAKELAPAIRHELMEIARRNGGAARLFT